MRLNLAPSSCVSLPTIRLPRHAVKPWVLAAVLVAVTSTDPGMLLAQPGPAAKPLNIPPLTVDEQAAIKRGLAMGHQDEICSMPMRLQVTHASLADIAAHLKPQLPQHTLLEVRHANPARFTLDLKAATLRQVLQAVADLADCNFYILSDRFLLATDNQLTSTEREEAKQIAASSPKEYFQLHAMRTLASIITAKLSAVQGQLGEPAPNEVNPAGVAGERVVTFGQLSPQLQQTVQQFFNLSSFVRPLAPDETISFAANNQTIYLKIQPGLSSRQRGSLIYRGGLHH